MDDIKAITKLAKIRAFRAFRNALGRAVAIKYKCQRCNIEKTSYVMLEEPPDDIMEILKNTENDYHFCYDKYNKAGVMIPVGISNLSYAESDKICTELFNADRIGDLK